MDPDLQAILAAAIEAEASDVHLASGEPVYFRIAGELIRPTNSAPAGELAAAWIEQRLQELANASQQQKFQERGSVDGAFTCQGHRFRFNAYLRQQAPCLAIRRLSETIPSLQELGIDPRLYEVCNLTDGLILVAGPTGSGKSTTIAALIDRINQQRQSHVITIEDPVEFLHPSKRSLVNQRQVGHDVESFQQALLDAMRQDPDVILVGELRGLETIRTAITAAETGHLVLATVHAGDTKTAIERLVSAYSADEQNLAQRLVATVLRCVLVQHLLPRVRRPAGGTEDAAPRGFRARVLATERVHVNAGLANLIASGNLSQLASLIQTSGEEGMWTLDDSLAHLLRRGQISQKTALSLARQPEMLGRLARRGRGEG